VLACVMRDMAHMPLAEADFEHAWGKGRGRGSKRQLSAPAWCSECPGNVLCLLLLLSSLLL
jgi:hypothetical protein